MTNEQDLLVAGLVVRWNEIGDPNAGVYAPVERAARAERRRILDGCARAIQQTARIVEQFQAKLDIAQRHLKIARAAERKIEAELRQPMPTFAKKFDRDREVRRRDGLKSDLQALREGVVFYGDKADVRNELVTLLGGEWLGALPFLESRVSDLQADVQRHAKQLTRRVREGEQVLVTPVLV